MDNKIDKALKEKVIEASGCTEPIAIAYAAAYAASKISKPVRIEARLSVNVIKNAMIVCLPGSEGRYGIALALSLGALYGDPSKELNVIAGLSKEHINAAEIFANSGAVDITAAKSDSPLLIEVCITGEKGDNAFVRIKNYHTNICFVSVNGKTELEKDVCGKKASAVDFDLNEIWNHVLKEQDFTLVDKIININDAVSKRGLSCNCDCGLNTGKAIYERKSAQKQSAAADKLFEGLNDILERTTAGVDARMAGVDMPVMANSGSGNQGLVATLPVIAAADVLGVDNDTKRRAVLLSSLIAIYIKSKHSALSAYCGAVIAGSSSSAAMVYLAGGSIEQIKMAIQNSLGNSFGVLCDGAKETCSLKVANSVFCAVYSAYLALKSVCPKNKEGIICQTVESTLDNIAALCESTSCFLDEVLIEIMLKKIN